MQGKANKPQKYEESNTVLANQPRTSIALPQGKKILSMQLKMGTTLLTAITCREEVS